jgi:hypothetical protein
MGTDITEGYLTLYQKLYHRVNCQRRFERRKAITRTIISHRFDLRWLFRGIVGRDVDDIRLVVVVLFILVN